MRLLGRVDAGLRDVVVDALANAVVSLIRAVEPGGDVLAHGEFPGIDALDEAVKLHAFECELAQVGFVAAVAAG